MNRDMKLIERKAELEKRMAKAKRDRTILLKDAIQLDDTITRDERELRILAIAEKSLGYGATMEQVRRVFPDFGQGQFNAF